MCISSMASTAWTAQHGMGSNPKNTYFSDNSPLANNVVSAGTTNASGGQTDAVASLMPGAGIVNLA